MIPKWPKIKTAAEINESEIMRREEKNAIIAGLTEQIDNASHFYLADISELNSESTHKLVQFNSVQAG